ncbi:outer membrane beta-barrel protein [Hymenobacter sp. B81]|uniref:outer membrane beta-barrel protein n=1 Tax=Hymenobacter sp. B81 TaxID=3344878 RepID=UPI0037DC0E68
MKYQWLTAWALVVPLGAAGQQADSVQAPPAAAAPPLTFFGYVEGYYGYDFRHARQPRRPAFLYAHARQNEFSINNALVGLRYEQGHVRAAAGLHAGTYVAANYAAEEAALRPIYEAYAGFRPFRRTWLDVGIFSSHLGFESAIGKDNWTLSRSLMAENSPYYEAGARLTYEASPRLTLTALVLNGWQNIGETNGAKALGTQVQWKPTARLVLNSSSFYGNEQPRDSVRRRRYFHHAYASYAATRRLSLAVVADVGWQESEPTRPRADTWHTAALLARFQLAAGWHAALRGEYYRAGRGVIIRAAAPRGAAANLLVRGASLNLDHAPSANLLVRVEGRLLSAPTALFDRSTARPTRSYVNVTTSLACSF